ncbi:MAG TPA: TIGR03984 family CRISPR-associated protein [Cyanobacteria bacterium UBA8553]|nr:TIGR03984 family CRISPR-associated protein [Cyanobacteria bacterium UBA8553]
MTKPICTEISVDNVKFDLSGWLQKNAKEQSLRYLLAHADDGVIWGEFRDNYYKLVTSRDICTQFAELRLGTLQQCRIFSKNAELMLWKIGQDNWKARLIKDDNNPECLPDEHQILWGTQVEKESNGFTLVSDGSQGLKHAVPLFGITDKFKNGKRPLHLTVRHYIEYSSDGVARIYLSRLVDLFADKGKQ